MSHKPFATWFLLNGNKVIFKTLARVPFHAQVIEVRVAFIWPVPARNGSTLDTILKWSQRPKILDLLPNVDLVWKDDSPFPGRSGAVVINLYIRSWEENTCL